MAPYWKLLHILAISSLFLAIMVESQVIRRECREKCGNLTVPYPFGIGEGCALNDGLIISCDETDSNPPKAFLAGSHGANNLPLINISLNGTLLVYSYVASNCYTQTGELDRNNSHDIESKLSNFYYSATRNKFTVLGCDTYATLSWSIVHNDKYVSGCLSVCYNKSGVTNGSCSGIGCCQASIPRQLSEFNATIGSLYNHTHVQNFNPCSYAFIADVDSFSFSTDFLKQMPDQVITVLDWAIGDQSCNEAKKNTTSYACKDHSYCQNSDNGPGYRCVCNPGYRGNPYVQGGCKDINECEEGSHNCIHICENFEGSYRCLCPKWYYPEGRPHGQQGCTLDKSRVIHIIIGIGIVLFLLASANYILHSYRRKQIHIKRKKNFFKQNGGTILQDRMSRAESLINTIKIFDSEELEVATDNFSESRICGRGGFGTVYKGYLPDGRVVAIKRSKAVAPRQTEQFINEITVVSQIKHKNVVRILGCCFETPEPLLVYEFITNGTLSDHIHNKNIPKMPWNTRLKIAAETAGVLAYLHSAHSPPIIHRDIKPTNLLLDNSFSVKVSDFGCSKLIPMNEHEMCTMVQGTLGYLDPEYLQTNQLTEKSDVYSFGVVLIELLTGLKVVSFERSEEDRSLVNYFVSLTNEDSIMEILDKGMANEDNVKEIMEVAKMTKACVAVKGKERPRMKEIARELEVLLTTVLKHTWATDNLNMEEAEYLVNESPKDHRWGSSSYSGMGEDYSLSLSIHGR